MNVGRSLSTKLARVTVEPSASVSSKSGARSPTLLPIFAVTTGTAVAVGDTGVAVGGTAVAVGGTGVDVGGTAVAVGAGGGGGVGVSGRAGIAVGGAEGASVGTAAGAAVGSGVDVGAVGAPDGAPVYTADTVGEGCAGATVGSGAGVSVGPGAAAGPAVGAGGAVGATVGTLVGVAVSWTTATAGAVVGAAGAGAAGALVGGAGSDSSEPHATTKDTITTSATTKRPVSLMFDPLVSKCQSSVSQKRPALITQELISQFLPTLREIENPLSLEGEG